VSAREPLSSPFHSKRAELRGLSPQRPRPYPYNHVDRQHDNFTTQTKLSRPSRRLGTARAYRRRGSLQLAVSSTYPLIRQHVFPLGYRISFSRRRLSHFPNVSPPAALARSTLDPVFASSSTSVALPQRHARCTNTPLVDLQSKRSLSFRLRLSFIPSLDAVQTERPRRKRRGARFCSSTEDHPFGQELWRDAQGAGEESDEHREGLNLRSTGELAFLNLSTLLSLVFCRV
jgi:hypothetical protein